MRGARVVIGCAVAAAVGLTAASWHLQGQEEDVVRSAEGGGISVDGWTGKIDAGEAASGLTLEDAKLSMDGGVLHVTTGPAVGYWNPANTASGDYTVSATFHEPQYQNLNSHPHPYGLFIAGSDLGSDEQRYLYCAAYGNGTFIVRGFGPEPFQMNGRRAEAHPAVHQAAGIGSPVTQDIALSVRGGRVECSINGQVVAGYDRAEVVGAGKLASTDGVYGIRFGHNTEGTVANLRVTRP